MRRALLLIATLALTPTLGCSLLPGASSCFDWTSSSPASAQLLALGYQGGGPSYAAILTAYLEHESPAALAALSLDDEGDALRVCGDAASLQVAHNAMERLERDPALLRAMIAVSLGSGEME